MSCDCENRKRMSSYDYVKDLAKKTAKMEKCIFCIYKKENGEYSFDRIQDSRGKNIVEYIHYL